MKILQVNKFFRVVGGSERYLFECSRMLEEHGHEVAYFSMEHPDNQPCAQSDYFVNPIEYKGTSLGYKLKTLSSTVGKTVYSFESQRKMTALLEAFKPDLVHLHMISHQISPSILPVIRKAGIPIVQTCHEYKLVCPNYKMYIESRNEICERCLGGAYRHAVHNRCIKDSLAGSVLAAGAMYFHKATQIYEKNIDLFLPSSQFMADKFVEAGIPESKLRHVPNYINLEPYQPCYESDGYVLYMGRLSEEKGIATLLKAKALVPELELVIAGTGPLETELRELCAVNDIKNVRLVGYQEGDALKALISKAAFVVIPSEWYENDPLVTLEAFATGKPVIGAQIGGIPERIQEGETGLLFESGNVEALSVCLQKLSDTSLCREMGENARTYIEGFSDGYYDRLMDIYAEAGATP
ncbi:MAG: glycosyltransferase [Candidatus Hydrogenedentota bacterium]